MPIWTNDGTGWQLLATTGFPGEAALHTLVEQAPQILPLAGSPRLIILGREVLLGNGYADLIAVEPTGRLAIIEVKLARNAEARRAIVAQVLTYAAYLNGLDPGVLERDVLGRTCGTGGMPTLSVPSLPTTRWVPSTRRASPRVWPRACPRGGSASSWSSTTPLRNSSG